MTTGEVGLATAPERVAKLALWDGFCAKHQRAVVCRPSGRGS
jgi:hypothetical protein